MGWDQFISLLVAVTLIEMMVATGLGVRPTVVIRSVRDGYLITRAGLANYIAVPLAAVLVLRAVHADPMIAAGILILAVCPGAPYAPPLATLGRGATETSVGLMIVLAGTSMVIAPLLLVFLIPLTTGDASLHVSPSGLLNAILGTQILPLCLGLAINHWWPDWAARWLGPSVAISKILNSATLAAILTSQFQQLLGLRLSDILGMLMLLGISFGAGWMAGGGRDQDRKAMALTTSIRNVGLGLVLATGAFAGTSAIAAIMIYGLLQLFGGMLIALWWRRGSSPTVAQLDDEARP